MKTRTLNTIQKLSKLGKILCTIIFIFCLIGAIGCIVGIICLAAIPGDTKIGDETFRTLIEDKAKVSFGTAYTAMAMGAVFAAGEAVLCRIARRYFVRELESGTPFTFAGAQEMKRLGIFTIAVPLATSIINAIVYAIMYACLDDVGDVDMNHSISLGLGVMFIVTSLICKYGAEVSQGHTDLAEDDI